MGKQKIAELTFKVDKTGAKLVLIGPQVGPAKPSIGVLKDEKGNYHFAIGHKDSVIAPAKLPDQLKRALESLAAGKKGRAPFQLALPSCTDLILPNGRYMSYQQYQNARVSRMVTPGQKTLWPYVADPVYQSYVQLCQQIVKRFAAQVPRVR